MVAATRHRLQAAGADRAERRHQHVGRPSDQLRARALRRDLLHSATRSRTHPTLRRPSSRSKPSARSSRPAECSSSIPTTGNSSTNMGSRVEIEPDIVERDGTRCVRTYSWHVPEAFGDPHLLEIAPIFVVGGRATLRSYPVTMWPFTRAELKSGVSEPLASRQLRCRRDSRRRAVHRDRAPTEARAPVGPGDAHRQEGLVAGRGRLLFDRSRRWLVRRARSRGSPRCN